MNRTVLALLTGLALLSASAAAQGNDDAPEKKESATAVFVVGITGMT